MYLITTEQKIPQKIEKMKNLTNIFDFAFEVAEDDCILGRSTYVKS